MAKKGSGRQKMKDLAAEYAYLVTLACVIAVIAASAAYTKNMKAKTQETLIEAAAGAPEVQAADVPETKATPLPTIAPLSVHVSLMKEKTVWPVDGGILRHHDLQEHVLWEALHVWQPHAGLDIAGDADQSVRCAADGTVVRVTRDALWGGSVEITQEDGRQTCYRGLALCCVDEEDTVVSGQEIGTLLDRIPCEAELDTHLHIEVMRGGMKQDPLAMLPERYHGE